MSRTRISKPSARRRPGVSSKSKSESPENRKPWHSMFHDYGFKSASVPETDPPSSRDYGEIFEWVTKGGWHTEAHERLIMDMWLGYVDPRNYVPESEMEKAVVTEKTQEAKPKVTAKKKSYDTKNIDLLGGMSF